MKRIYGYCRISRKTQNIERQERNILAAYPDAQIYKETYTGTKLQGRKQLDKILNAALPGDLIVFDSVSRMSRNADEGVSLYKDLFEKGVEIVFLKEPHVNTSTYREQLDKQLTIYLNTGNQATDTLMNTIIKALNNFLMDLAEEQIRLAFGQAQKEVDDLHQRTAEGIETARRAGKQIGRAAGAVIETKKSREAKALIRKHCRSFGGSLTNEQVWKLAGISKPTFYTYLREIREQEAYGNAIE